jgi:predicted HTH domain antitoxin
MVVYIPDTYLEEAHLTATQVKLELAIWLFQQEHLTMAQAARLAGLHRMQMQRELGRRKIPIHYGIEELQADMKKLNLA